MNFEDAKTVLNSATRWELRDHAFGDCEFGWTDAQGNNIAEGYSGGGKCHIWFNDENETYDCDDIDQARELKQCGTLGPVTRNDEVGPDDYSEGYLMPGLTKEAVLDEITKKPVT
jgi:hypothetical protein